MTNSSPSSNLLQISPDDGLSSAKEALYKDYLDQERFDRHLRNKIKEKVTHKSLDLPMEDPMNITNTTTHNHNYPKQDDEISRSIRQLEDKLSTLAQTRAATTLPVASTQQMSVPSNVSRSVLGKYIDKIILLVAGSLIPIAFMWGSRAPINYWYDLASRWAIPYYDYGPVRLDYPVPRPKPEAQPPVPRETAVPPSPEVSQLKDEVAELRAYLDKLKNRKYTIRHFDSKGQEVYVHPLPESNSDGDKRSD